MKTLRSVFAVAVIALLGLGYFASQFAAFNGPDAAAQYASRVDQPQIQLLALVIFVGALVLPFLPEREEDENPS